MAAPIVVLSASAVVRLVTVVTAFDHVVVAVVGKSLTGETEEMVLVQHATEFSDLGT